MGWLGHCYLCENAFEISDLRLGIRSGLVRPWQAKSITILETFKQMTDFIYAVWFNDCLHSLVKSESAMKTLLTRLFLIAMPLVMGILFIVFGIRNHSLGKESENWPTVQGSLVSESSSRPKKKKRVHVFYEYQVNGLTYKNSRVNFRDDKASKKKIRDRYKVGDALKIHYQPGNPEQSVLEPGASIGSLMAKIAGGLFCFALSGVFLMIRRR